MFVDIPHEVCPDELDAVHVRRVDCGDECDRVEGRDASTRHDQGCDRVLVTLFGGSVLQREKAAVVVSFHGLLARLPTPTGDMESMHVQVFVRRRANEPVSPDARVI